MEGVDYKVFEFAIKGDAEPEELENALFGLKEDPQPDVDILLVSNLPELISHNYDIFREFDNPSWHWFWQEIADGEYPLKKLPEHVRDLAKTLYYNKKNSKKRSA